MLNNGTCVDGSCECLTHYSGENCEILNPPDSIKIYRVEFDYWYYNNQTNSGSVIQNIEYSINNTLYHDFNISINTSNSNFNHDFLTPITISLLSDELMTFSILQFSNILCSSSHNVFLDGSLDFELENGNTGLYKLRIFNSNGDAFLNNGEFSFVFYCKLI